MTHKDTHGAACACHSCEPEITAAQLRDRAEWGGAAVRAGTPDVGQNGDDRDGRRTDAADAIANILHWLRAMGGREDDIERALQTAFDNYDAEAL